MMILDLLGKDATMWSGFRYSKLWHRVNYADRRVFVFPPVYVQAGRCKSKNNCVEYNHPSYKISYHLGEETWENRPIDTPRYYADTARIKFRRPEIYETISVNETRVRRHRGEKVIWHVIWVREVEVVVEVEIVIEIGVVVVIRGRGRGGGRVRVEVEGVLEIKV